MSFLKNIFGKNDVPINSNTDFWNWFQKNEKTFYQVVKKGKNIEVGFFDKLTPKLDELKDGYFFLTGMLDDNTAELILTADGIVKNIVFVEDLVNEAPIIDGWKFTALKPEMDINNTNIHMGDYEFSKENMFFYYNEFDEYPDEIDLVVVHQDYTEENKNQIGNGCYIFLDNYLGELEFLNNIDNIKFKGPKEAEKELIPISKLKDFLNWRQKEFVEKYEGVWYNTDSDQHSLLEANLESGNRLLAVINTEIIKWERKASHPWIAIFTLKYDGNKNDGLPTRDDYEKLDEIYDKLMEVLKDFDGYLNVGRQTANNERDIYFACRDFRKPSKVFFQFQKQYSNIFVIEYDIYKDKYWQTFERFSQN